MRITCDYDFKNPLRLAFYIAKGTILLRRFPRKLRKTKRGYHCVWYGTSLSEKEMYKMRYRLGDDRNRIRLDMTCEKKPKQVLFEKKEVHIYEYDSFGNFERKTQIQ